MSDCHQWRPTVDVDDLIWQLQNINLYDQEAEQEENQLQEEQLLLWAEEARLIEQLAIAYAITCQEENNQPLHKFSIGDRVVIDNPNPECHGRAFHLADWQGW